MEKFSVWGGYSYGVGSEEFESLLHAAREYVRRMSPSVTYYPLWGDVDGEDIYVLTNEDQGWTLSELQQLVEESA